jgi:hypothetical protein
MGIGSEVDSPTTRKAASLISSTFRFGIPHDCMGLKIVQWGPSGKLYHYQLVQ